MSTRAFLLGWLRPAAPSSAPICSAIEFRAVIEREQMRSSRTGGMFVLVVFSLNSTDARRQRRELSRALGSRLRATDAAGFVDDQLVVMLPETTRDGADLVAKEIWAHTGLPQSPEFDLFTCPESVTEDIYPAAIANLLLHNPTSNTNRSVRRFAARPLPDWKRAFDIAAALCGLLLVSPILIVAILAIKLTSRGPILFTQMRTGHGGQRFKIYKLRTMLADSDKIKDQLRALSEQDGPAFKMKNDPRLTRVGAYLRKTAIDELPQLWNVLIGDMTMVDPRPLACDEADQCLEWQNERLNAMPGLTCSWQSSAGRSRISFSKWMRMDIRYARTFSFWQDLKLIGRTAIAVVMHRASC
jgi:lipopolysaccharide/colanic/teichoic acid biosynthesis glycosyltransferase